MLRIDHTLNPSFRPPHQQLLYTPDGGNKDPKAFTFTTGIMVLIFTILYITKCYLPDLPNRENSA